MKMLNFTFASLLLTILFIVGWTLKPVDVKISDADEMLSSRVDSGIEHSNTNAVQSADDFTPFTGVTFPDLRGESLIDLSDYSGNVVVLNWGRSNCGWTLRQTTGLVELYNAYRDKDLEIIGIMDENSRSISSLPGYVQQPEITWPLALMDQGEYAREILPKGTGRTPETFLITRSGELRYIGLFRGDDYWEDLEGAIAEAVAEPVHAQPSIRPRPPRKAPAFSLPDLQGNTMTIEDFKGKPLVVHFFSNQTCSWVGDLLGDLHRQYSDRGVGFVGIGYGSEPSLEACTVEHGIDFPVLVGDRETQRNWDRRRRAWAVYFISPEGEILKEIDRSITNGIEEEIYPRYVELLASGEWGAVER